MHYNVETIGEGPRSTLHRTYKASGDDLPGPQYTHAIDSEQVSELMGPARFKVWVDGITERAGAVSGRGRCSCGFPVEITSGLYIGRSAGKVSGEEGPPYALAGGYSDWLRLYQGR